MSFNDELIRRAEKYVERHGLTLKEQLGSGVHGIVFTAHSLPEVGDFPEFAERIAIKVHRRDTEYRRERDIYLRLSAKGITDIDGYNVPALLNHDDDLLTIEMAIVTRPFVLDFAGAYLDHPPEFSDEVMADWLAEKIEQFGPRWGEAANILRRLEAYAIFMIDVNPGNIGLLNP